MTEKVLFLLFVLRKWLPRYVATMCRRKPQPTHVLFCMVDHYEPGAGHASPDVEILRVPRLIEDYPKLADQHKDADGRVPRRTWFFPPHYHRHGTLRKLVGLCERGYGEIELHLHHGKSKRDTAEHLEHTIRLCIEEYSQFGVFGMKDGRRRYGFIHGDWALANSRRDGLYCGVDDEIDVLVRTGCYADFTFPSCNEANPTQINSIFYAPRDGRRNSHRKGRTSKVGCQQTEDLLMIQGPLHPIRIGNKFYSVRAFGDDVTVGKPGTKKRVDHWIRTWIHVLGRPEWLVVKVHTHGAMDADIVLGDEMHDTFHYLQDAYNDRERYALHFVTARELFNIVKAAEAGEVGDPAEYLDYEVLPPIYDTSTETLEASDRLRQTVSETYFE